MDEETIRQATSAVVVALKDKGWVTNPQVTGYELMEPVNVRAVAEVAVGALMQHGYMKPDRAAG